jgi:isopropylmalate/homocitrate/citramalate synthase
MRDGEQSPGASMSLEEKIQIARVFDELGVDIIEAGFPIASPGDFEAVSEVSKILKNSIPAGLSRHSVKDIDRAYEALKHAPRFRIHTFISTSPLHMKHKLNMSPEGCVRVESENMLLMQESLLMMLSGLVKMEQELIWIICAKQLSLLLKVGQRQ